MCTCLRNLVIIVSSMLLLSTANVNQFTVAASASVAQKQHEMDQKALLPLLRRVGATTVRRDQQIDPCDSFLQETNSCLVTANPTCGVCVRTAFDLFLETITTNFTCDEYKAGVCPVVYEDCSCSPCNTQLESYFNCVLNDASQNECPVAYCDPLKDFSAAPEQCLDNATAASACIGYECLTCLRETIEYGASCTEYTQTTCNAINFDCLSCLNCMGVVEPWLQCIAVEGKACDAFRCSTNSTTSPSGSPPAPTTLIDNSTSTTPTSAPLMSIVETPTLAPQTVTPPTAAIVSSSPNTPTERSVNTSYADAARWRKISIVVMIAFNVSYLMLQL